MASLSLAELTAAAEAAEGPGCTPASIPKRGGVDPLGLRQINFDLMDDVLPGLNNVARRIKPFVVVTWALRRAVQRTQASGSDKFHPERLHDFVDRIEVIYAWSQMLRDPRVDLPGARVLAPLLRVTQYEFGGRAWQERRNERRNSTALSAPVNYGPGLRSLHWATPLGATKIMIPSSTAEPAIDSLEEQIGSILGHAAFNEFGPVVVTRDEARAWGELWAMDCITDAEARTMRKMLVGPTAPVSRRLSIELIRSAAEHISDLNPDRLRAATAGTPSTFVPAADLLAIRDNWRRLQIRQLFRLSLEALFYWIAKMLEGGRSRSMHWLIEAFLDCMPYESRMNSAGEWITCLAQSFLGPVELMTLINEALLAADKTLTDSIAIGLAFCICQHTSDVSSAHAQQVNRLPLSRARQEALARLDGSVEDLVRHILESWVLGQHAYWSVDRGLADARTGARALLRLKIIIDEDGWTLTRGMSAGGPPGPTQDRLNTAVSLATECGLL